MENREVTAMKKVILSSAAAALWGLALPAAADSGVSIGVTGGTLGVGLQLGIAFTPYVALRGMVAGLDFSEDFESDSDDLDYDGDFELRNAGVILDYHPWGGWFRVSGGAFLNDNKLEGEAECEDFDCDFGGESDVLVRGDKVSVEVEFNSVVPFVGVGWSGTFGDSGWQLQSDLGVLVLGDPDVDVELSGPSSSVPGVQSEAEDEAEDVEDDLEDLSVYPALMVGVSYRF